MENTAPIISVIVPVYKVEKYLGKCLESILDQSFEDIEVLLIDDGSPDSSGVLCDHFSLIDSRVKVFHKENGGVGSARNYGIERALGKYLAFIDSDDWIEPDMLETLYTQQLRYNAELSVCGMQKDDEEGNVLFRIDNDVTYLENQHYAILTLFNQDKYYKYQGWVYNKLYLKELVNKYHIRFHEEIAYSEDRLFNFDYLKHVVSAVFSTQPKYHYLIRANSAMTSSNAGKVYEDKFSSFIPAFEEMFQYSCVNYPSEIQRAVASNYTLDVVNLYLKYRKEMRDMEIGCRIRQIVMRMLPSMSSSERIIYRIFLVHPLLYYWFIKLRYYGSLLKTFIK
ncbi:glycosyltransferase involved in cell wall biosynthesis [Bacteroides heparinolyticus]|uniref:Glycosyltransferase involved in cell wall biosynthesis n=1 Tax=Prevotella heparinolytica TaxID=28113 RepID=A0A4R2LQ52_9BACE|nr:glycosyltransferase family 2 protein [Bacteroides heparinolyticus]TCO89991.1 glycosyltransferase involved in cell wall biosynthesis [Bacteroides heparinolyticus]